MLRLLGIVYNIHVLSHIGPFQEVRIFTVLQYLKTSLSSVYFSSLCRIKIICYLFNLRTSDLLAVNFHLTNIFFLLNVASPWMDIVCF